MASNQVPFFSSDPDEQASFARQAALIQQRQALSQALLQQGMTPLETQGRQVGGIGYRISPFEGLAKMLQAYAGRKGMEQTTGDMADLQAQGAKARLAALMGQDQPQQQMPDPVSQGMSLGAQTGSVGPTNDNMDLVNALRARQAQSKPGLNFGGMTPGQLMLASSGDPAAMELVKTAAENQKLTKTQLESRDPLIGDFIKGNLQTQNMTELQKLQLARRLVPDGSERAKQLDDAISKANYIAPIDAKPGTPVLDPRTLQPKFFAPKTADGINLDFTNPLAPTASAIPGYAGANAGIQGQEKGAVARAQAPYNLVQGYDPITKKPTVSFAGNTIALPGSGGQTQPPQTPPQGVAPAQAPQQAPQGMPTPQQPPTQGTLPPQGMPPQQLAQQQPTARPQLPVAVPTGPATGEPQQIESTQKRWGDLQTANAEASNTKSYLQSIKGMADKAATGQFTDRLQFTNSLLGLIGNEKAADATTANNLLDKYSNQIVARLGQGGLGTDSARAILQSAYPNAKMTPQAIREAADNLIGAQDMVQAKARLLQQHGNSRDVQGYQQAEQAFDQAADPRVFQIRNMDAQSAARYIQSLPPQVQAELRQKAAALKQMGVF